MRQMGKYTTPPVLLIVFRRADLTRQMLENISQAKPTRFYIACDGPRTDYPADVEHVQAVRDVVAEFESVLKPIKLYHDKNLGCGVGVSTAISWFFEHEEEGIILEDDCYPDPTFYRFCAELLERYRHDTRVMYINGYNNFFNIKTTDDSYRFTKFGWQWGWATWRRAWSYFDLSMSSWPEFKKRGLHKSDAFDAGRITRLDRHYKRNANAWAAYWGVATLMQNGLGISPMWSLVTNTGAGYMSTHGLDVGKAIDRGVPIHPMEFPMKHPPFIFPDMEYDRQVMRIASKRGNLVRRILGKLKRLLVS